MPTTIAKLMVTTWPNQLTSLAVTERTRASSSTSVILAATALKPTGLRSAGGVARAGDDVVVHHAHGLGEGVDNHRPAEIEAALLQILRQRFAHFRFRRNQLLAFVAVD